MNLYPGIAADRPMVGLDTVEILRKLRHKEGLESVVLNAPGPIEEELERAGFSTEMGTEKPQFTLLFVRGRAEVEEHFEPTVKAIEYDSLLWLAYPKGGSSIKTDINRDKLWEMLKPTGYRPVAQVSIDRDWSAIRFRPTEKVKTR